MTENSQGLVYTITDAGMAAVLNHGQSGLSLTLTHIALGDGSGNGYDPSRDQTALVNEIEIHEIQAQNSDKDFVLEAGVTITPETGYWIHEIGIYADDILFAVWSSPNAPLHYSNPGKLTNLVVALDLSAVPVESVTVKPNLLPIPDLNVYLKKNDAQALYIPISDIGKPGNQLDDTYVKVEQLTDEISSLNQAFVNKSQITDENSLLSENFIRSNKLDEVLTDQGYKNFHIHRHFDDESAQFPFPGGQTPIPGNFKGTIGFEYTFMTAFPGQETNLHIAWISNVQTRVTTNSPYAIKAHVCLTTPSGLPLTSIAQGGIRVPGHNGSEHYSTLTSNTVSPFVKSENENSQDFQLRAHLTCYENKTNSYSRYAELYDLNLTIIEIPV